MTTKQIQETLESMPDPRKKLWFEVAKLHWPRWEKGRRAKLARELLRTRLGGSSPKLWPRLALLGHDIEQPREERLVGWLVAIQPNFVLIEHSDEEMWGLLEFVVDGAGLAYSQLPFNVEHSAASLRFYETAEHYSIEFAPKFANSLRQFYEAGFNCNLCWTQHDWTKSLDEKNCVIRHNLGVTSGRWVTMREWLKKWLPDSSSKLAGYTDY